MPARDDIPEIRVEVGVGSRERGQGGLGPLVGCASSRGWVESTCFTTYIILGCEGVGGGASTNCNATGYGLESRALGTKRTFLGDLRQVPVKREALQASRTKSMCAAVSP